MNARVVILLAAAWLPACSGLLGYDDVEFSATRRVKGPSELPGASDAAVASPVAGGTLGAPLDGSDGGSLARQSPADGGVASPEAGGPITGVPGRSTNLAGDVCQIWQEGHRLTDNTGWTAGATECDPGSISQAAVDDTLVRLAMFRKLVGLAPVTESTTSRGTYMACGAVASWNPPGTGNPHAPDPSAKCYTQAGAAGAGSANIGWGQRVPADAIDQFVEDWGNETTFGHRRWVLNPSLGQVGIGFYAGGGPYGSAQCLGVFDGSGTGPSPDWIAMPPPGDVPQQLAQYTWTFHHKMGAATGMTVKRVSDGMNLPMTTMPLNAGYGVYGVTAFRPSGWAPTVGDTYEVEVTGLGAPIVYQITPKAC